MAGEKPSMDRPPKEQVPEQQKLLECHPLVVQSDIRTLAPSGHTANLLKMHVSISLKVVLGLALNSETKKSIQLLIEFTRGNNVL